MKILSTEFPSFKEYPLHIPMPPGFLTTNASVTLHRGDLYAVVNAIDHHVDQNGVFMPNSSSQDDSPARNRTFLALLDFAPNPCGRITARGSVELNFPEIIETPWPFRGFESPRLFSWGGSLHVAACSHAAHPHTPGAKFFMGRVEADNIVGVRELIAQPPEQFEKNWMPDVRGEVLSFHHRLGTLIDLAGRKYPTGGREDYAHLHGGTQIVHNGFESLCIVHDYIPADIPPGKLSVQHFAKLSPGGGPRAISERFQFTTHARTEIATGMALMGSHMIVSYGRDNAGPYPFQERPFIASFTMDDLGRLPYDDRT